MKKVLLKKVKVELKGVDEPMELDYHQQYKQALLAPKDAEKGTNYAEMVEIMPIAVKFGAAEGKDYILLEDAEHKILSDKLQAMAFRVNSMEIFEMIYSLRNAPDHLAEAKG